MFLYGLAVRTSSGAEGRVLGVRLRSSANNVFTEDGVEGTEEFRSDRSTRDISDAISSPADPTPYVANVSTLLRFWLFAAGVIEDRSPLWLPDMRAGWSPIESVAPA